MSTSKNAQAPAPDALAQVVSARTRGVLLVAVMVAAGVAAPAAQAVPTAVGATQASAAAACSGQHWVGSWNAAPSDAGATGLQTVARPLSAQTVRMVIRPTRSSGTVRLRLSNRYATTPAALGAVTVALRASGASAVPGSIRPVMFAGRRTVTLPAGGDVRSDAVALPVSAGKDVLVSIDVPGTIATPNEHFTTDQTNYLSVSGSGDHSSDVDGTAFPLTTRTAFSNGWYFLTGLDVMAPRGTGAVVAFGDSITDGFQGGAGGSLTENPSSLDKNMRYPDLLSLRLRAAHRPVAVLNAGISGNRVLTDAERPYPFGAAALARLPKDALALPGVSDVIILEGINDLGRDDSLPATAVIQGLSTLARRAKAAGLRVHLATLTPSGGASQGYGTAGTTQRRQQINRWIRSSGYDVIDFDKAVRDPADPTRLRPAYDSSDHLHPSGAGYKAMAAAINLTALRGRTC